MIAWDSVQLLVDINPRKKFGAGGGAGWAKGFSRAEVWSGGLRPGAGVGRENGFWREAVWTGGFREDGAEVVEGEEREKGFCREEVWTGD